MLYPQGRGRGTRGIRLRKTGALKFGGPKKRLEKQTGSWCSSLQAVGTCWKLLRERTGQVLGNRTQKERQLSINLTVHGTEL